MGVKCHLSKILGERRIKISEFAKMAGITKVTALSLYHEKAKGISFEVLEKICNTLEIQVGDLLEVEKTNSEKIKLTEEQLRALIMEHIQKK